MRAGLWALAEPFLIRTGVTRSTMMEAPVFYASMAQPRPLTHVGQHVGMHVDAVSELIIAARVEQAAAFAADPENAPLWYQNISSVEWLTPKRVELGSKVAFVARFLGRTLRYTYEIAEYIPGERVVMRTTDGPFPMETTYTWSSAGDGQTRMTLRNRGAPSGFSKLMSPFMASAMRRANRKDLAKLASILEGV